MTSVWLWAPAAEAFVLALLGRLLYARGTASLRRELRRLKGSLEGERSALELVASAISSSPERPVDSLSAIVSIVARATEADVCAFLLYDESSGELAVQPGAYGLGDGAEAIYRMPLNNPASSSVRVFTTGEPFLSGDALNDPQVIADYAKRWNCHSLMVVPLTLEDRRVGVMRVGKFERNFFTEENLKFVRLIAEEAVVLVESAMLNRKLAEANQKLSQVNRMKDDLVSTVSHEFKTPLTSIKGFLSLLLSGDAGPLGEDQRKFLEIIRASADRLHSLVHDLLDLSRLEGGGVRMDFKPVDLGALIEQCRREHEPQARESRIRVETRVPDSLPRVLGDGKWLRQALDNLVSNALKFTPSGGAVVVAAADEGERVRLTVEDTGIGIGPEDRERIFDRFYRARGREAANAPGTGLGLAIVKFVVDKHEGEIWVESEPGRGSRFHCALPAARRLPARSSAGAS